MKQKAAASRAIFVSEDGGLDVPKITEHFIREHNHIHGESNQRFYEEEGRERFLTSRDAPPRYGTSPLTQPETWPGRGEIVYI